MAFDTKTWTHQRLHLVAAPLLVTYLPLVILEISFRKVMVAGLLQFSDTTWIGTRDPCICEEKRCCSNSFKLLQNWVKVRTHLPLEHFLRSIWSTSLSKQVYSFNLRNRDERCVIENGHSSNNYIELCAGHDPNNPVSVLTGTPSHY